MPRECCRFSDRLRLGTDVDLDPLPNVPVSPLAAISSLVLGCLVPTETFQKPAAQHTFGAPAA